MAITQSFGYTDTPTTTTVAAISPANLNYKTDFAVKDIDATNNKAEVKLVNTTTPLGQSEIIRIGYSTISNIYANREIPLDNQLLQKEGRKILVQVQDTLRIADTATIGQVSDLPVSAQIVVTVPNNSYTTDALISSLIARALGTLYDNGKFCASKILKGAVTPTDL